ncbi:unnamed protein product, partial [Nesidiocoris tenuis]
MKCINKFSKQSLYNAHSTAPILYGKLKTHKTPAKLRPVVANYNGPTQRLAKWYNNVLKPFVEKNPYDIKNAQNLVQKLKGTIVEDPYMLVSFDVKELYPSVKTEDAVTTIRENWSEIEKNSPIKDLDVFIEGFQLCCNSGYFKFNEKTYRQLSGQQMGGSLSSTAGKLVMNRLLDHVLQESDVKPKFIFKYEDDLLLAVKECE